MKARMLKKFIAPVLLLSTITAVGIGIFSSPKTIVQARDWDDDWDDDDRYEDYDDRYDDDKYEYDDRVEYKGNISISNITNYRGTLAAIIKIPNGIRVTDVDVDFEPHPGIEETISGNNIIIYGLMPGITYNRLILTIEGFNDVEYKFNITPFTTPRNNGGSNNSSPNTPNFPTFSQNSGFFPNNNGNGNTPQFSGVDITNNKPAISQYLIDVYRNIFNRKVDEGGLNYWTKKLSDRDIDLEDFFKNLLCEAEFNQSAPTVEDKIRKIYEGVFGRKPDEEGFRFWVDRYKQELMDEGDPKEALEEIIDQMTDGQEFMDIKYNLGLL